MPTLFKSTSLAERPAVQRMVMDLGLGTIVPGTTRSLPGRNDVATARTDVCTIFIKRLTGSPSDIAERTARLRVFARCASVLEAAGVHFPEVMGVADDDAIMVTRALEGTANYGERVAADEAPPDAAGAAGLVLGGLHSVPLAKLPPLDHSVPHLPDLSALVALPVHAVDSLTNGELEAWALIHRDEGIRVAVTQIVSDWPREASAPTHCDIRLDQFLCRGDDIYLCDWEEFRQNDPARDVGAFVGQFIYHALGGVLRIQGAPLAGGVTTQVLRESGAERIHLARPHLGQFWSHYCSARPERDAALAHRAVAWAGWHLFDRMIAAAARMPRVSPLDKAAAGVGRRLLLEPSRYADALGLAA